ncbi:MAG: M48 family metallopeptidase [Myxococcales bacterium]|nr:M48 family metallopeptidase [Myxococcales bacterium]
MERFDFSAFVDDKKTGRDLVPGDGYAFEGDLKVLRAMRSARSVELAVSQLVKLSKNVYTGDLLGTAVRVGPSQFPRVHRIAEQCARRLGIKTPQIYVVPNHHINAMTAGTEDDSFIVIHSATLEHMTDDELRFIIGHECGHIQNKHVVYLTTLRILQTMAQLAAGAMLAPLLMPVTLALNGWSRAAEITCDRAGLLCVRDLRTAEDSFLKLAVGSRKLFQELNREVYLAQLGESQQSVGRMGELKHSHPYLTKRIEALRIFSRSAFFREAVGLTEGLSRDELERQTTELVKVI